MDGKPAERAQVTFHGTEGPAFKPRSFALTKADGTFRAFTFDKDDGVPTGDYAVTIVLPQYSPNDDDDPGPDLLEGRYADPSTTKLRVSIRQGDNDLPAISISASAP